MKRCFVLLRLKQMLFFNDILINTFLKSAHVVFDCNNTIMVNVKVLKVVTSG